MLCVSRSSFTVPKKYLVGATWTLQMQLYKCHIESYCVRVSGPRLFVSNEFVFRVYLSLSSFVPSTTLGTIRQARLEVHSAFLPGKARYLLEEIAHHCLRA